MTTGYSHARAMPHQVALQLVFAVLAHRGYKPHELDPDGDRPDIRITDADGQRAYVDVKVPLPDSPNVSIKRTALETYARIVLIERAEVYIVCVRSVELWKVDTVDTIRARMLDGPRRPTGNGSLTDWVLCACGGTNFDEYFAQLTPGKRLVVKPKRLEDEIIMPTDDIDYP